MAAQIRISNTTLPWRDNAKMKAAKFYDEREERPAGSKSIINVRLLSDNQIPPYQHRGQSKETRSDGILERSPEADFTHQHPKTGEQSHVSKSSKCF
jgi:hypothetical protein